MSITINAQLFGKLEARMEDLREAVDSGDLTEVQKVSQKVVKALAEMRGTAATAPSESSDAPKKKSKKAKAADGEEKPKRAPSEWSLHCKNVLFPLILPIIADAKKDGQTVKTGFHLRVAGYLKDNQMMNPSSEEVERAFKFLMANPDYQSKTQISRSPNGSVAEAKGRGRPKKEAAEPSASEAAPTVVVPVQQASEDSDDDDDDDEEETTLAQFEHKGVTYLKDQYQEVYTNEGEMMWVGTFNGKKIVPAAGREMSPRVKKTIEDNM